MIEPPLGGSEGVVPVTLCDPHDPRALNTVAFDFYAFFSPISPP